MANLKIGAAHNEAGEKFFASNSLTAQNGELYWNENVVLHSGNFTISSDFTGTGTAENPLTWNGLRAQNNSAGSLASNIKTLKAGENVFLEAENGVLTISASGGGEDVDLSDAVLRYLAEVSEDGIVTIADGTLVTEVRIGDEIVTPQGVYKKVKDSIPAEHSADGTRLLVSGITNPAQANGIYVLQEPSVWKHESQEYWIVKPTTSEEYWVLSDSNVVSDLESSLFYSDGNQDRDPWEAETWTGTGERGSIAVENYGTEEVIDNTLDLFEYASLPEGLEGRVAELEFTVGSIDATVDEILADYG